MELFEDATFDIGTSLERYALNRVNVRDAGVDILAEPTNVDTTQAELINPYTVFAREGGAPTHATQMVIQFEYILKPNTAYILSLTNASTNEASIDRLGVFWYWYVQRD